MTNRFQRCIFHPANRSVTYWSRISGDWFSWKTRQTSFACSSWRVPIIVVCLII